MARQIYLRTYIAVGFIALLIFSVGFLISAQIDNERIARVEKAAQLQELNYKSLQFQQLYINTLTNNTESCPVFEISLQSSIDSLTDSLERMEAYKSSAVFNQGNFDQLARTYVLDNLRYWLFARKTQELCSLDFVPIIYFYSDSSCGICPEQGVVLSYYKKIFDDRLLVFPINVDLKVDEASIPMLMNRYNVTSYPTIIVGEAKYEGVVSKNELLPVICSAFKEPGKECLSVSNA